MADKQGSSNTGYWLIAAGLAVLTVVAVLGILLSDDTGTGIAFAGSLVTGAVSLVGLVLKQISDSETRAADERDKKRRDVEAATSAANLLSTPDGRPADPATTAGALLSLVRLEQVQLASSMLSFLWEKNRISDADGVFIVNEALNSDDRQSQRDASNVLLLKTPQLTMVEGKDEWYYWPFVVDHNWKSDLPIEAKYTLLRAWVSLWMGSEATSLAYRLRQLTAGLVACLQDENETDLTLKCSVASMLRSIWTKQRPNLEGATEMVEGKRETFTAQYIDNKLAIAPPVDTSTEPPDDLVLLEKKLREWLDDPDKNRTKDILSGEDDGSGKSTARKSLRSRISDLTKERARARTGPR